MDRRVPVAIIAMMILQIVGVSWWAATQSSRVDTLERDGRGVAARLLAVEARVGASEALAQRIDERTAALVSAMARIERALDRIASQGDGK